MKLKEKISWLMGHVQRSLFSHLNECLDTRLTAICTKNSGLTINHLLYYLLSIFISDPKDKITTRGVKMYGVKLPKNHIRRHDYLGDFPKNLEKSWTEEIQGVTTDNQHWYFTQNGFDRDPKIRKFYLEDDLRKKKPLLTRVMPDSLLDKGYDHFGDLDHFNGYLFIAVTGEDLPAIATVFRADDLKFVGYDELNMQASSAGWCAINPADSHLYSSAKPINKDKPIRKYEVDFGELSICNNNNIKCRSFLKYVVDLQVNTTHSGIEHPQGGAFTPDGFELYIANGWGYGVDFGIRAFDVETGAQIAKSSHVNFVFDMQLDEGGEPEGIAIHDLDNEPVPGIKGQLHAILLRNDYLSKDNLFFKHYSIAREMTDLGPPFVGNNNSKEFHTRACWWGSRITQQNQVHFETLDEALAANFDGCGHCLKGYSHR